MSSIMEDYQGNSSFTRWATLGLLVAALCIVGATVRWPAAKDALLHAFDKVMETAVWIFLGGKSPEVVAAFSAKIKSLIGTTPPSSSGTAPPA